MLIILPFIAFALLWILTCQANGTKKSSREAFLYASLAWGAFVGISCEILSLPQWLTPTGLSVSWTLFIAAIIALLIKNRTALTMPKLTDIPRLKFTDKIILFLIICILITIAVIALVSPPNNWDSMTYHMSRVAHWAQNKSVQFFPTSMPRQVWASPWAEYAIAHLYILNQSDAWANMVQFFSMLGSVLGVTLIAQLLGADRRGQLLSALLCVTLPVGILEASSTQNDYAAAFWMVCFVYFGLKLQSNIPFKFILAWAAALALAFLTKATAIAFATPFAVWTIFTGFKKFKNKFLPALVTVGIILLLLNAAQCARNYTLGGNPLSLPWESKSVKNQDFTAQAIISNAIRYLGVNLAIPNNNFNNRVDQWIRQIHNQFGWDAADPRYTMGERFYIVHSQHEDTASNSAATVVILFCVGYLFFHFRKFALTPMNVYVLTWISSFLLFCFMLRWQPFGNRLLVPLAVLACAFAGPVLASIRREINFLIALAMVILCLPWLINNTSRPLFGSYYSIFSRTRGEQYFNNVLGMHFSYARAAEEIRESQCKDIALVMTTESWEYPLWPYLNAPRDRELRIEHVLVNNETNAFAYPLGNFDPCIAVDDTKTHGNEVIINNTPYTRTNRFTYLSLYRKDPDGRLKSLTRKSNLNQMIALSKQSDEILIMVQTKKINNPTAVFQAFRLRQSAVEHAQQLVVQELEELYKGLGQAVTELFIQGSELLLDGVQKENSLKMNQGQQRLNQWNSWLVEHSRNLQDILQEQ